MSAVIIPVQRLKQSDKSQVLNQTVDDVDPCMYVINSTSLAKINAFQQVTVDAKSVDADIIIVTETWLKAKHAADAFVIPGFICIRKDRIKRRGGGVCVCVRQGRIKGLKELWFSHSKGRYNKVSEGSLQLFVRCAGKDIMQKLSNEAVQTA